MGSGSEKQETMAKMARERALKGRRDRQQQQKRAAAAARDTTAATRVAREDESDRGRTVRKLVRGSLGRRGR